MMQSNPLCTPWEHRLSRRQWLGGMAAAAAACGLGSVEQLFADPAPMEGAKGKQVALVPEHAVSLWTTYEFNPGEAGNLLVKTTLTPGSAVFSSESAKYSGASRRGPSCPTTTKLCGEPGRSWR